jgi:hypothetical protein
MSLVYLGIVFPSEVRACGSAEAVEWKEDMSQNAYRGLELEILCPR